MTVNIDQLRERIRTHVHGEWRVVTEGQLSGPVIKDRYNDEILAIDVSQPVWTCDDEQDGCPEIARDAVALAQLLVDLPSYALELMDAYERVKQENQDLERDLEECEHQL